MVYQIRCISIYSLDLNSIASPGQGIFTLSQQPSAEATHPIIVVTWLHTSRLKPVRMYSFPTWHQECHTGKFNSTLLNKILGLGPFLQAKLMI